MKIRTQLLLACFVLAVLPLTGIVVYSYQTSRAALENAYQREARRLTAQMDRRLATIQADLDQRLATVSALPLEPLQTAYSRPEADPARKVAVETIQAALGEAAPLVETLQLVPAVPRPRAARAATVAAQPAGSNVTVEVPPAPPAPAVAGMNEGDGNPDPPEPIVIDIPRTPTVMAGMPADFGQRIRDIVALSRTASDPKLSAEARQAIRDRIVQQQQQLDDSIRAVERDTASISRAAAIRAEKAHELERRRAAREEARQRKRQSQQEQRNQTFVFTPPQVAVRTMRVLTAEERDRMVERQKEAALLFGYHFNLPMHERGEVVGHVQPQLNVGEIVKRVLGSAVEDSSEIPFAVDREGKVYTRNATEQATLEQLGIVRKLRERKPLDTLRNWVVAMSAHRDGGLRLGVIRPVGENLEELRHTAARNFGWGVGVIAFALLGMLPIADHFSRDIKLVTDGAERVAHGDLQTRVPVRSPRNEFGQLAMAFNQMAEDLSVNQQRLFEQERARQEQELQQRLLELEYERKSVDLEDARRFQLSMLPKHVPQHELYDVAVLTQTAAEVGGDYYDFHVADDGVMSVTIGDATGHGAKAGTMVTVIKTLFAGYDGSATPAAFLGGAAEKIKRMDLGRMAMALSLVRLERTRLTIAAAGMPPLLVHRAAEGRVEEVALPATPLGTLGVQYEQTEVALHPGDTVLLMTDGLPELLNEAGQQLGYIKTAEEFAAAAPAATAAEVLARLASVARQWHGDQPPNDDVTFVAVRVRA